MTLASSNVPRCRSCNAPIRWLRTERGRRIPVDAATAGATETTFDYRRHTSHFATCPHADQHRTRKR